MLPRCYVIDYFDAVALLSMPPLFRFEMPLFTLIIFR